MNHSIRKKNNQNGITLLVTLLTMGVLLSIMASLMFITLKQFQLSGIVYSSEIAFQAASAGVECALFHDFINNTFDVPGNGGEQSGASSMSCFGVSSPNLNGAAASGEEQLFEYPWAPPDGNEVCTEISVYKFFDDGSNGAGPGPDVTVDGVPMKDREVPADNKCPQGSECTVVQSRGYNVGCSLRGTSPRVVEREYTQVY